LLIIGPRTGRFPVGQPPQKIQGNNLPMAMLGIILLFFGWFGFNGGSTLTLNEQVPGIIANTALAGASGLVVTLFVGWFLKKLPEASLPMNGVLAGLVAITANCHAVNASSAVIIGAVGGIVMLSAGYLLERFKIDDVIGAVPVHLAAGIWGTIAVALFGDLEILGTDLSRLGQLKIQAIGIGVCFVFAFVVTYIIFLIINRFSPLRVTSQDEYDGLNVAEHGATTELIDLLKTMERHKKTQDLSIRVLEEPFTEVGQIARQYNHVIASLNESMEKVRAVVNYSRNGIFTFLKEGLLVTSVNPSLESMFGYASNELIGKPINVFLRTNDNKENFDFDNDKISNEVVVQRKSGETFSIDMIFSKVDSVKKPFYVGTLRDITARRKAQTAILARKEALEETTKKLQEKTNRLNRFQSLLVGREHDMIKLKQEINELLLKLGQPKKFQSLEEFKKKREQQDLE